MIGCGGDVSIDELPAEVEDAICSNQVACGVYPDVSSCRASLFAEDGLAQIQADVDSGLLAYDADALDACLDAIRGQSCAFQGFQNDAQDPCGAVLVGQVEVGGECTSGGQCAGGGECVIASCPDACCVGLCEATPAPVQIGQDCSNADCVDGAYCERDAAAGTQLCAVMLGEGQACENFFACSGELYCNLDFVSGMGVCTRPAGEGQSCDPTALLPCARFDNYCDPAATVCNPRLAVGEACDVQAPRCALYAYCDATSNTCAPLAEAGEACDIDGPRDCLGALDCLSGTCVAPEADPVCSPTL